MMSKELTSVLDYALNRGFQIHPDALEILKNLDVNELQTIIKKIMREKTKQKLFLISQDDLEIYLGIKEDENLKNEHKILSDPSSKITSAEGIEGFNLLFSNRYSKLKAIISHRPEAKLLKSISSVVRSKSQDSVYICGLVSERKSERNFTKLKIEDDSASIEVIVVDSDLQKSADVLLLDQFVMLKINSSKHGGFFVKDLVLPDVPERQTNRSETETYAVFLSDLHIGSKYFMEEEFNDFVSWVSSTDPVARKVRYILIGGDVVDGVGIYPNQDRELECKTIEEQLEKTNQILSKIPQNIKIFLVPGNHDPGRRALPQPAFPQKYNSSLWKKENFYMLGNPSMVSLNGVKILIYHGQSIDDIVKTTPGLSYDKPARVMRQLMRARHLCPIYGSQTPIAPELEDLLVVDQIPDIFHVGHVHVVDLDFYRGILLINSGAWQKQTPFQASVGVSPTPGLAVIVNLKTFKVYYKDFKSEF